MKIAVHNPRDAVVGDKQAGSAVGAQFIQQRVNPCGYHQHGFTAAEPVGKPGLGGAKIRPVARCPFKNTKVLFGQPRLDAQRQPGRLGQNPGGFGRAG